MKVKTRRQRTKTARRDSPSLAATAKAVARRLRQQGITLTLGGEPSYVPLEPEGAEWNFTALGPTKLGYARALADALIEGVVPGALSFFSLGKLYPGEINPRWAIHLLWKRDGSALTTTAARPAERPTTVRALASLRREIHTQLQLSGRWQTAQDRGQPANRVWVLPLDHVGRKWSTTRWPEKPGAGLALLDGESPAGLRLPLDTLPANAARRALVLEYKEGALHIFFPPFRQRLFLQLLRVVGLALSRAQVGRHFFEGYVPSDERGIWSTLSLTADPGVLEVNLPPCADVGEYARWLERLERCTATAGLRSFKQPSADETLGTGGGNHILFGGPSFETNAFFKHPRWITSMLRYWQHHPSLSYLFTGSYVGSSSQAPRPDESAGNLYDLEMAYQFLETLEPGVDHRQIIGDTLRHLHIDRSGNTHRSEISFDKFWNTGWPGGCRGLIEFRAVESLPHAEWMSHVALLWASLAAFLFESKWSGPLLDHGARLHDAYFLPSILWNDFDGVLRQLERARFTLDRETYRQIWEYRFPTMLRWSQAGAGLTVRKALEDWPLLSETPLEGGQTSRFVDTSIERLELTANDAFVAAHRIFVQGREVMLHGYPHGQRGAGLRYRRTALHPSLHPGMPPHIPLVVTITSRGGQVIDRYDLRKDHRLFFEAKRKGGRLRQRPCQKPNPELLTYDLRLP